MEKMQKVSYKRLWKLLIDKGMKKVQLKEKAQISGYNIGRLTRDENVSQYGLTSFLRLK